MARKTILDEVQFIAASNGGRCLNPDRYNISKLKSHERLLWECAKGHQWKTTSYHIKEGKWCRECAGLKRLTIFDMKDSAARFGGVCLSKIYKNNKTKLIWKCKSGHTWQTKPNTVRSGRWCPTCAGHPHLTLDDAKRAAKMKGGRCLAEAYQNNKKSMLWECANAHRWTTNLDNILRGSWCPTCNSGINENLCRQYFEHMFHEQFPKVRPRWLRGNTGKAYELDGFCQKLNLAFEYNGIQHYTRVRWFRNRTLEEQQVIDQAKKEGCKKMGVSLITIPSTVLPNKIGAYILTECGKLGIVAPNKSASNTDPTDFKNYNQERLSKLQQIAKSRGGMCLSKSYVDSVTKLHFRCAKNHEWMTRPTSISVLGCWCPICSLKLRTGRPKRGYIEAEAAQEALKSPMPPEPV